MKDVSFMSAVSFLESKNNVGVRRIPLSNEAREDLNDQLLKQYDEFIALDEVDFDGTYKNDDDERFKIKNYIDHDHTIENFKKLCDGSEMDVLKKVDDLMTCKAILTRLPDHPKLILIQRFTNHCLAQRAKWYQIYHKDTVAHIEHSAFTFPSKIAGYYNIETSELYFRSLQSIRAALPGFSEKYIPEAGSEDINKYLQSRFFDQDCVRQLNLKFTAKIRRLFWLLIDSDKSLVKMMARFEIYDRALNLGFYDDGVIKLKSDTKRLEYALRILLEDVYESNGSIYLSNSKRKIKPFK